jgi:tRNA nucleotidyltransferase (CCA-adding enzyme)
MAMALNRKAFGRLVDLGGGREDLRKKRIRALHPRSFFDDPTRILRAVRLEERLGFRRERQTAGWMRQAVRAKALMNVQKHRLRDELVLLFREPRPYGCLRRLHATAGLAYVSPRLRFDASWSQSFRRAGEAVSWFTEHLPERRRPETHVLRMALFLSGLPLAEVRRVCRAFAFRRSDSRRIESLRRVASHALRVLSRKDLRSSVVYRTLEPLSYEVILGLEVLSRDRRVRRRVRDFLLRSHGQRIHVTGEDLKAMGLKPGPAFKRILEALLRARLDGRVTSREEELAEAARLAGKA